MPFHRITLTSTHELRSGVYSGDHIGSTTVLTAQDGTVHQSLEYFPDGETWIDRGPAKPVNRYLFSGKAFDPDTGFYDFGQRFYDPRAGIWLGVDPALIETTASTIGTPVLGNPSAYAANSPALLVDPDGRQPRVPQVYRPERSSKETMQDWANRPAWRWASTTPVLNHAMPYLGIAALVGGCITAPTGASCAKSIAVGVALMTASLLLDGKSQVTPIPPPLQLKNGGTAAAELLTRRDISRLGKLGDAPIPPARGVGVPYEAHQNAPGFGISAELDQAGVLDLVVKAGPNTPKGHQMFEEALAFFGNNVKAIRGNWGGTGDLNVNFIKYHQALINGATPEEAAFATNTGQWARNAGFTRAAIQPNTGNRVVVLFSQ